MNAHQIIPLILLLAVILLVIKAKREYWRGRIDGWSDCEKIVILRAKCNPKYSPQEVYEDLHQ